MTKAYETLAKIAGELKERLDWVLGGATLTPSRHPGGSVSSPAVGNAALQLWQEPWGIVWGPPGTGKTECRGDVRLTSSGTVDPGIDV